MKNLNYRMVTDHNSNMIRIDFQKKVGWLGLSLQDALVLRELLGVHIDALQKLQFGVGNGRRN